MTLGEALQTGAASAQEEGLTSVAQLAQLQDGFGFEGRIYRTAFCKETTPQA